MKLCVCGISAIGKPIKTGSRIAVTSICGTEGNSLLCSGFLLARHLVLDHTEHRECANALGISPNLKKYANCL